MKEPMNKDGKALTIEQFRNALKKNSLKATPQRIAVHKAMLEFGHASADMITDYISKKGEANITVASVYNILSQLAELGIYERRMSINNKMYFDVNKFSHIHFYDNENNEFQDIMDEDVQNYVESQLCKKRFKGYKIDRIDIQIVGHPTHKKIL